ncbi:MAG: amidohydrolase family protein [Gammaproteobacteria bacterium]|nr:amidohydrolase family protein [Gammaproteobacteria bacterium]
MTTTIPAGPTPRPIPRRERPTPHRLRPWPHLARLGLVLMALGLPWDGPRADPLPIFDVHLHYDADHQTVVPPETALGILDRGGIAAAVVTSRPPDTALALHEAAPELIVPFLGIYQDRDDKENWHQDEDLPGRVEKRLDDGPWAGIGELHIFAEHRRSPVFGRIVDMAAERGLVLQMHCDPAVIDALFSRQPDATVIWAHAGRYPYPPLLKDYLERYPGLHIDLSTRDDRLGAQGGMGTAWQVLLLEYEDRFMVGVDTYSVGRWESFGSIVEKTRSWLDDLPRGAAKAIACDNAARLFDLPVCDTGS